MSSAGFAVFLSIALLSPVLVYGRAPERALPIDLANRSRSLWLQVDVGGSIYDARREVIVGRFSPGLQFGRRFDEFGFFLNLEADRSFDFTQKTKVLDVIHVGGGIEYLQFAGHVRTSLSGGVAILRTDTLFDDRDRYGYYVDLRPVAIRWAVGQMNALELAPLALDISVPVAEGIPLILFSYFSVISFEWAGL